MVVNVSCEEKKETSALLPSTGYYVSCWDVLLVYSSRNSPTLRRRKKEDGRTLPGHVTAG